MSIWIWHCCLFSHLISPAYLYLCLYLSLCKEKRVGVSLNVFENVIFRNSPLMNILIFPHQWNNFHTENSFWDYIISIERPLLYLLQAITLKLAFWRQTYFFYRWNIPKNNKLQTNWGLSGKRIHFPVWEHHFWTELVDATTPMCPFSLECA